MSTYSLHNFTTFVRRVLALNLPEALWIKAELAQVNESRGHVFLNLVEKSEETEVIIAQVDAVIWQGQLRTIVQERGKEIADLLQSGLEVRIKVTADFHDRFGFKLIVKDIDPVHTMGKLAQQRIIALRKLEASGLLHKQAALSLPTLPQRIAIISSETAAGYADFRQQLTQNVAQYQYQLALFPASMQGALAPIEIARALRKIERRKAYFDLVVLIRGGGARMDLIAFDDLALCEAVAEFSLPILTGIGHETDEVLLDHVANKSFKTPTAVAAFLLEMSANLERRVLSLGLAIQRYSQQLLTRQQLQLDQAKTSLQLSSKLILTNEVAKLQRAATTLPLLGQQIVQTAHQQLQQHRTELAALDPQQILKRGYAILAQDGKIITSVEDISDKKTIFVKLSNGEIILQKKP